MKNSAMLFTSCQREIETSTSFFQDFSLQELVEKTNAKELKLSNGSSTGSASNGEMNEYRCGFTLDYRIEEQNDKRFNESRFFDELKVEIAKKIGAAEVRSNGNGSGDSSFYFNFSNDKKKGWIEVVGARLEGNRYKL